MDNRPTGEYPLMHLLPKVYLQESQYLNETSSVTRDLSLYGREIVVPLVRTFSVRQGTPPSPHQKVK